MRGKEGNSTTPTKFLPLHFVKDKMFQINEQKNKEIIFFHDFASFSVSELNEAVNVHSAGLLNANP